MLVVTPFKETESFLEAIHEKLTQLLLRQIKRKYQISGLPVTQLGQRLEALNLVDLKTLSEEITDIQTLHQLNEWLDAHTVS